MAYVHYTEANKVKFLHTSALYCVLSAFSTKEPKGRAGLGRTFFVTNQYNLGDCNFGCVARKNSLLSLNNTYFMPVLFKIFDLF